MKANRFLILCSILSLVIVCAWAVENQSEEQEAKPKIFDPQVPSEYPVLTDINVDIRNFGGQLGRIYMVEGIENSTSVRLNWDGEDDEIGSDDIEINETHYPNLVMYGVFHDDMRDWRDDIIDKDERKYRIDIILNNERGTEVLRVKFYNCIPIKFSLPPLSVDSQTRYMERMEFAYTHFEFED